MNKDKIKKIEELLGNNIVGISDLLDLHIRQGNKEVIQRIEDLKNAWILSCEIVKGMEGDVNKGVSKLVEFINEKSIDCGINYSFFSFCKTKEEFVEVVKKLGSFEKVDHDTDLVVKKEFGDGACLKVFVAKHLTCKKIMKEKIVPAEEKVTIEATPERVELVAEYECPESILKG